MEQQTPTEAIMQRRQRNSTGNTSAFRWQERASIQKATGADMSKTLIIANVILHVLVFK